MEQNIKKNNNEVNNKHMDNIVEKEVSQMIMKWWDSLDKDTKETIKGVLERNGFFKLELSDKYNRVMAYLYITLNENNIDYYIVTRNSDEE